MREGVAASRSSDADDERSNVIPFPDRTVDYAGSAMKLMAGLSNNVGILQKVLANQNYRDVKPQALELLDKIIETMEIIEEHMGVLEDHADLLRDFIEPGDDVYFSSRANRISLEVVSLVERRSQTLMVQKLFFEGGKTYLPMIEHDNERQTLFADSGAIACKWPRCPGAQ